VGDAQFAPAYLAEHLSALRLETLLTVLGVVLFLWFLGTLWSTLRAVEAGGRGSTLVLIGGTVGSGLALTGLALSATAGLATSDAQAGDVATLYAASALLTALAGGVSSLFFFGVAKAIFQTRALPRWLGVLAYVVAVLALFGFFTPFFDSGAFNAATGVLGRWAWTAGFVVWLFLASLTLTIRERHTPEAPAVPPQRPPAEPAVPEVAQ
jgi:hypothetical protein